MYWNGDVWWVQMTDHTNWANPDDSTTTSTSDMATRRQQPPKPEPGFCPRCGIAFDEHDWHDENGVWLLVPRCPKKKR